MTRYPMKRQADQTIDEMAQQLAANANNRLNRAGAYPEISAQVKQEALAQIVSQQREMLKLSKDRGRRINLDDLDEVEKCADRYLSACVKGGVFPTMMGFAAATGWSRPTIYRYIQGKNTESARYLDNLRSSWAAIISQMALTRQASEAVSIFLLKNSGQDLKDSYDVTAYSGATYDPDALTPEEQQKQLEDIYARYAPYQTTDTDNIEVE